MTHAMMIAAKRTAVVPQRGAFAALPAYRLAAAVIQDVLGTAGLHPDQVDEVILGNALGAGGNPARLAALAAGCPERVGGLSIDRQCCSGLDAVILAARLVQSGAAQVVVAGGAESHSCRPMRAYAEQDGTPRFYDRPAFSPWPDRDPDLTEAADALGVSRTDQDNWAIDSHARALHNRATLGAEITALAGVASDPFSRSLSARLVARAPVLHGSVTAANTAVAADGAAFCVITSAEVARRTGRPTVQVGMAQSLGGDPDLPGIAPVAAIRAILAQEGAPDHAAIMEAYAAQVIACVRETGLDPACVNQRGGALARGHPIGASGAVEAVRLFHDLTTSGHLGVAAIAAAGGLGTALALRA